MHDTDRMQTEYEYEDENAEYPSQEYAMEDVPYESEGPAFNETEEMELTSELMELNSEEEFESFLGEVIRKAAQTSGGYISPQTGQSLGSLLKGAAKQLLPLINQAVEGGELEGEGAEQSEAEADEQEWEAANTFVKLAGEAAKIASNTPPETPAPDAADQAVKQAAQVHAPDLVGPPPPDRAPMGPPMRPPMRPPMAPPMPGRFGPRPPYRWRRPQGRWIRRGNQIILLGA